MVMLAVTRVQGMHRRRNIFVQTAALRGKIRELEGPSVGTDLKTLDAAIVSGQVRHMVTSAISGSARGWNDVQQFIQAGPE